MTDKTPQFPVKKRLPIKRIALATLALLVVLISVWLFMPGKLPPGISLSDSWVFRENQTGPIIGDLGGVPVSIPKPYANLVEYDGDPNFLEKRKGAPPQRAYQSKLRSFGFDLHFPDMRVGSEDALEERGKQTIRNTMWIGVGVSSGEHFGGAGELFLEKMVAKLANPQGNFYRYEPLTEAPAGLNGFYPAGPGYHTKSPDPSRRADLSRGVDGHDENLYFHRDESGRVTTYIVCNNVAHEAARCRQYFSLLPAMRAHIDVGYRRGLLPQWREIQSAVTTVILGFRIEPEATHSNVSSSGR